MLMERRGNLGDFVQTNPGLLHVFHFIPALAKTDILHFTLYFLILTFTFYSYQIHLR
jgi:hypothetical protein